MSGGWEFLLSLAAKGVVVLGAAFLLSLGIHRASASTRHLLWTLALAGVLFLPFLSKVLPGWRAPVLPATAEGLAARTGVVALISGRSLSPARASGSGSGVDGDGRGIVKQAGPGSSSGAAELP